MIWDASKAHPRSRGENTVGAAPTPVAGGSSPLTRGKRVAGIVGCLRDRLIPAHAGKTPRRTLLDRHHAAHPRSRGENTVGALAVLPDRGSSPLTRGKPCERVPGVLVGGLIPAHAGKTAVPGPTRNTVPAHPRSRGENHRRRLRNDRDVGSSPLTRGKPGSR